MSTMIYHMCPEAAWRDALARGRYAGTPDDKRDGFIHFSTAAQIAESAHRHRAGQQGLVLISVDATRCGDRLKWEKSRGGDLFPHLYGPLFPDDVARIDPLPLGPDGEHVFPPLT